MQLFDLKQEIKAGKLRSLYIFIGPEVGIRDIYIDKIKNIANIDLQTVDSLASIYNSLSSYSFTSDSVIYKICDDKGVLENEKIWSSLKNLTTRNTVILTFNSMRKNTKFYKFFEDVIVEFERLGEDILSKYAQKFIGLNDNYAKIMAELCDKDYNRLVLECNKVKNFNEGAQINDINEAFKRSVNEGLIYQSIQNDIIFQLIDAVVLNKHKESFELLAEYQEIDNTPFGFLTLLYNNFKQILMVQGLGSRDKIVERTGLTYWQVKNALTRMGRFSVPELIRNLRVITDIDRGVKNGSIDANMAGELTLCMILK